VTLLVVACGGGGSGIDIPDVPAGEYETECQALCTIAAGDPVCTAVHAEYCLASCRARTNGMPPVCGDCLIVAGGQIAGAINGNGDSFCFVGGAASITSCPTECDDNGAAGPSPALAALCDMECGFYITDPEPLACSDEGSSGCRTECAAAIAAQPRVCAQCLIDQTVPSRSCFGDECDCEPLFDESTMFGCMPVCS
jgi:hypothetical protein